MLHSPHFPFFTDAGVRLRSPRGLEKRICRAAAALRRIPREELPPAGAWIEDHARFLLGEADALRRALRGSPA